MNKKTAIHDFSQLGIYIIDWLHGVKPLPMLLRAVNESVESNPWFTVATIREALLAIAQELLNGEHLRQWLDEYEWAAYPKQVGVVMAGNIPLVGFHDFLCVLTSGHYFIGKLSGKDKWLLPALVKLLVTINPAWGNRIKLVEEMRIEDIDALIATGSNATANYFQSAAGSVPSLIRHNRRSVALLSGEETDAELAGLAEDIFSYYGLGCRNVSALYVPAGYQWQPLLNSLATHAEQLHHEGYAHNYYYQKALMTMQQQPFIDAVAALLVETPSLQAPPAVIHYSYYTDVAEALQKIVQQKEEIQCVVAAGYFDKFCTFGTAQHPSLHDYADGKNTMQWMNEWSVKLTSNV